MESVTQAFELVANVCFLGSVFLVVVSVFLRPLQIASPWADEGACFLFIWTVYLAAAIALKRNTHIRIDVMLNRLTPSFKDRMLFLMNVLCIVFCIGLVYGAIQMLRVGGVMQSPSMEISMFYFYLPLLLGFGMMVVYLSLMIVDFLGSRMAGGEDGR